MLTTRGIAYEDFIVLCFFLSILLLSFSRLLLSALLDPFGLDSPLQAPPVGEVLWIHFSMLHCTAGACILLGLSCSALVSPCASWGSYAFRLYDVTLLWTSLMLWYLVLESARMTLAWVGSLAVGDCFVAIVLFLQYSSVLLVFYCFRSLLL